jgi:hypothetical protein
VGYTVELGLRRKQEGEAGKDREGGHEDVELAPAHRM